MLAMSQTGWTTSRFLVRVSYTAVPFVMGKPILSHWPLWDIRLGVSTSAPSPTLIPTLAARAASSGGRSFDRFMLPHLWIMRRTKSHWPLSSSLSASDDLVGIPQRRWALDMQSLIFSGVIWSIVDVLLYLTVLKHFLPHVTHGMRAVGWSMAHGRLRMQIMQNMFFPIGFLVHSTLHFVPFPQLFSQTLNFHLTLVPLDHFLLLISFECLMASHKTLNFDGKVSNYTKSCRVSVSSKARLLNNETNMKTLQKQITKSC